jgi:3-hydroxyisobutyrate dehydrogenase-like beta-hydroxyacid dehydrogenase
MNSNRQVGVIGLGLLGSAIAERLVAAGFRPNGFDIDPATQAAFERRGAFLRSRSPKSRCAAIRSSLPSTTPSKSKRS